MPAILVLTQSSGGSECTGITGTLPFIESSPISFSGTKDNTFTITVSITTPTANRTLTVANETGTIALRESSQTFPGNNTFSGNNTLSGNNTFSGISTFSGTIAGGTPFVFEGATANDFETSLAVTDPTADRTITIPDLTGTLTVAATTAETKTGTATEKAVTPAGLLAAVGFSAYFESAEQTITSAGSLTIAHGLGREPIRLWFILVCKTDEDGWVAGEKVHLGSVAGLGFSASRSFGVKCDTTNILVRYGSNADVFDYVNFTTGNAVALTNANWRLVIRAWA